MGKKQSQIQEDKRMINHNWHEFWLYLYKQRYLFHFDELTEILNSLEFIFSKINSKLEYHFFSTIMLHLLRKAYFNSYGKEYEVDASLIKEFPQLFNFTDYTDEMKRHLLVLLNKSFEYGFYINDLLSWHNLLLEYQKGDLKLNASFREVPYPFYFPLGMTKFIDFHEVPSPYGILEPNMLQLNVFALDTDFDFDKVIKEIQEQIVVFRFHHRKDLSDSEYSAAKKFTTDNRIANFDIQSNYFRMVGIILFDRVITGEKIRKFLSDNNLLRYKGKNCKLTDCHCCERDDSCKRYFSETVRITDLCIKEKKVLTTKVKSKNYKHSLSSHFYENYCCYVNFLLKHIELPRLNSEIINNLDIGINKFVEEDPSSDIYEEIE